MGQNTTPAANNRGIPTTFGRYASCPAPRIAGVCPRSELANRARATGPQREECRMAGATVLIIDDDEDFTASIRTLLEAEGYVVATAASGREGLKKIGEVNPDVVLLDIMMESTTEGYAVSGAMKLGEMSVPVIMVSSVEYSPDELFARSEEMEMVRPDEYLTKPLDVPKFLETLRTVLARRVRV